MKLDRNTNSNGKGKYALIKLRRLNMKVLTEPVVSQIDALGGLENEHCHIPVWAIDLGDTPETSFFVVRLKDKYAGPALAAYAMAAFTDDPEWGLEILNLAKQAAEMQPKHLPD